MFDRYTERARRTIFFARYEASTFQSLAIRSEHILLGILREDKTVLMHLSLPLGAVDEMRKEITLGPTPISTSVDLPLSPDSKQALSFAAEEASAMNQRDIDSAHLMLGILRVKNCTAVTLLQKYGVDYATFRQTVVSNLIPTPPPSDSCATSSLGPAIAQLKLLIDRSELLLERYSDSGADQPLKRKPWTRKEALGHLIDCAAAHQQWFARILTEPKLVALICPQDDWVAAQRYRDFSWQDTVDLWVSLNRLIVHVLAQIPEAKLSATCQIGIQEPIALSELVARYVDHCEDIVGQILGHL